MTHTRGRRIPFAAITTLLWSGLVTGAAHAQGAASVEALGALLIDLPGCTAEKAETMSLNQGALNYGWANRNYECGDALINVMVGLTPVGSAPMVPGADAGQDMEMKVGPQLYRSSMRRGFRVVETNNDEDHSGGVIIAFGASGDAGALIAQFENTTLEKALALVERFDWAAMQKQSSAK